MIRSKVKSAQSDKGRKKKKTYRSFNPYSIPTLSKQQNYSRHTNKYITNSFLLFMTLKSPSCIVKSLVARTENDRKSKIIQLSLEQKVRGNLPLGIPVYIV